MRAVIIVRFLLRSLAGATARPRSVIGVLAVITVGLGILASSLELEVDLTQLRSEESEAGQAMDRVQHEFADPTAAVQVILDAGPEGNIVTGRGLEVVAAAERVTIAALGDEVRRDERGQPQVLSLGSAVGSLLTQQGIDPGTADDPQIGRVAALAVAANPQLAALVSDDFDIEEGAARGTVVVALLDPGLVESERSEAGKRVKEAFAADPEGVSADVEATVFSSGIFVTGLFDAIRAEVPMLFGMALLVVVFILAVAYRSVLDVVVGFVGMIATVIWTLGLASLLGPAFLGWTGPLTQLVVIIPVLLVGLGIDYSVHLTARYREQRAAGQSPPEAAGRALHTVGAALVLATAATAVGFASIATAPLQMLGDFGIFVAVGVVCAFVIMGLLVPSAQVLRDRRRSIARSAGVRELAMGRLMVGPSRLAQRLPAGGLVVAVVLVTVSLLAATGLEVEFDRNDFIPEGSEIEAVLARQQELFGGGVMESTFVVIDADLTQPAVANAVWEAEKAIAHVEGVRAVGDTPQVVSVVSVAAALLDPSRPPATGAEPPQQPEGTQGPPMQAWTGDGFSEEADLGAVYGLLRETLGEQRVNLMLAPDDGAAVVQIRTTAGDAGAERVQREVRAAFAPVERAGANVTITSEPIIITEMSGELSAFQLRAIALTLAVVLALLTTYYAISHRRPLLGVIAMIPAAVSASLILGTMWLADISFNMLTANLTAIAVGIGVPYGVHVVNRFIEHVDSTEEDALTATLRSTGGALTGSAVTTLGAFFVLSFSGLPPMRSLGLLGGTGIAFALLAAVLVEPGVLVWWSRRRIRFPGPA